MHGSRQRAAATACALRATVSQSSVWKEAPGGDKEAKALLRHCGNGSGWIAVQCTRGQDNDKHSAKLLEQGTAGQARTSRRPPSRRFPSALAASLEAAALHCDALCSRPMTPWDNCRASAAAALPQPVHLQLQSAACRVAQAARKARVAPGLTPAILAAAAAPSTPYPVQRVVENPAGFLESLLCRLYRYL